MHTKQQEKAAIIMKLNEFVATEPVIAICKALDYFIQDCREINDTCSKDELPFNQGKIAAFQDLKNYITGGITRIKKTG